MSRETAGLQGELEMRGANDVMSRDAMPKNVFFHFLHPGWDFGMSRETAGLQGELEMRGANDVMSRDAMPKSSCAWNKVTPISELRRGTPFGPRVPVQRYSGRCIV